SSLQPKLKNPDPGNQQQDADEVDRLIGSRLQIGERHAPDAPDREGSEWQVYREYPAPGGEIGDDAAERWAGYRAEHDHGPQNGQNAAMPVLRVDIEKHRLAERVDDPAAEALQDAEQDDRRRGGRDGTEQRGGDEDGDADDEQPSRPEAATQPAGQRRDDRGGAEIARHDPGAERQAAAEIVLQPRQRDIDDRRVGGLHRGRHHDGNRRKSPRRQRRRGILSRHAGTPTAARAGFGSG